jgi:hypothetical protein
MVLAAGAWGTPACRAGQPTQWTGLKPFDEIITGPESVARSFFLGLALYVPFLRDLFHFSTLHPMTWPSA